MSPRHVFVLIHTRACGLNSARRYRYAFNTLLDAARVRDTQCKGKNGSLLGCRLFRYDVYDGEVR